jgi:diadenosine tetraphosphate (Ap4A) HIT family hydrolase
MTTIFSRIIRGELPGTFVWREDDVVAFMSINPMARGHALVVPVAEVDHWIDADPALMARLFEVARAIGVAQERAFGCERVGLVIAGYEVPHAHIHVIPTNTMRELSFANAATGFDPADLEAAAESIRAELRAAGYSSVS